MKASRSVPWLAGAAALLAACAAGAGLFWPGDGAPFEFVTVHGPIVAIQGKGLYRFDTPIGALGFRGADIVTLFLAVPLLAVSIVFHSRGSRRAGLFLAGILAFLAYTYASMSFGASYNSLFIVYLGILSSSFFGLLAALGSFDAGALAARLSAGRRARSAGIFLVVCGGILTLLWVALSIAPALVAGTVAAEAVYYTTFVTGALDAAIVGPAFIAAGALLLRRQPLGSLLAPVLLVFASMMGPNLAVGGVLQLASGAITAGQAGVFTLPFVALTVAAIVFAARVFRALGAEGEK